MVRSEFEESYGEDEQRVQGAILTEPIRALALGPIHSVNKETTLSAVVALLQEKHIGCVLVTGPDGRLAGIFTERDLLLRVVGQQLDFSRIRVGDYMTKSPETVRPDDKIAWALNKMHLGGYRHVPIVDGDGRPIAVVSVKDVVDFIVELFPAAVLNLPPDPSREARGLDGG